MSTRRPATQRPKIPEGFDEHSLRAELEVSAELDDEIEPLRTAIEAMNRHMPRNEVWRLLQTMADRYRAGKPLYRRLEFLLEADSVLTESVGQEPARAMIVDAMKANGSQALYGRALLRKDLSKAKRKVQVFPPLPDEVLGPREHWLACNIWMRELVPSDAEAARLHEALLAEDRAMAAYEKRLKPGQRPGPRAERQRYRRSVTRDRPLATDDKIG